MTALYTGLYMPFGLGKGIQRDDAHVQILHIYMKYEILITLLPEKENKKRRPKNECHEFTAPSKKGHDYGLCSPRSPSGLGGFSPKLHRPCKQ